jgi:hypothetical protein
LLASVKPTIVLVEEAAEILESHILTNIFQSTKQLIMIGDHLQLRPKLEHYPLRTASKQGINFDMSLFERLVKSGYPCTTLSVQHRMTPEISQYVRHMTYPELVDDDSVFDRLDIRGVSSNVAFINHNLFETLGDETTLIQSNSYTNAHEVSMVVGMIKYLLQQGYECKDIVVLTPYLGQLARIRTAIQQDLHIIALLGSLDIGELKKLDAYEEDTNVGHKKGGNNGASLPSQENKIRIATVDNYQGEESSIIIASLVRSNDRGEIGFVSDAERANVLFSRARDGFFILGNKETLMNCRSTEGKKLWTKLLTKMQKCRQIFEGFPTYCKQHEKFYKIKTPEEFNLFVPNGGCDTICDAELILCREVMKHKCLEKCHKSDHTHPCKQQVETLCKRGHKTQRNCFSNSTDNECTEFFSDKCEFGHKRAYICRQGPPKICKTCKSISDKKKDAEKDFQEQEEKLNEQVHKSEINLEEMKILLQKQQFEFETAQTLSRHAQEASALEEELKKTSKTEC